MMPESPAPKHALILDHRFTPTTDAIAVQSRRRASHRLRRAADANHRDMPPEVVEDIARLLQRALTILRFLLAQCAR
jgi:hypothetical protein